MSEEKKWTAELDTFYGKAVALLEKPLNEWQLVMTEGDIAIHAYTCPKEGRALRAAGVVEGVEPKVLLDAIYNHSIEDKKRLMDGDSPLLEDHVVEKFGSDPYSMVRSCGVSLFL